MKEAQGDRAMANKTPARLFPKKPGRVHRGGVTYDLNGHPVGVSETFPNRPETKEVGNQRDPFEPPQESKKDGV